MHSVAREDSRDILHGQDLPSNNL